MKNWIVKSIYSLQPEGDIKYHLNGLLIAENHLLAIDYVSNFIHTMYDGHYGFCPSFFISIAKEKSVDYAIEFYENLDSDNSMSRYLSQFSFKKMKNYCKTAKQTAIAINFESKLRLSQSQPDNYRCDYYSLCAFLANECIQNEIAENTLKLNFMVKFNRWSIRKPFSPLIKSDLIDSKKINLVSSTECWKIFFGRVPKNGFLQQIPQHLIRLLYLSDSFKFFQKLLPQINIELEHDILDAVMSAIVFRNKLELYKNSALYSLLEKFPSNLNWDKFYSYIHSNIANKTVCENICLYIANFGNDFANKTIAEIENYCSSLSYNVVKYPHIANVCAKRSVDDDKFQQIQRYVDEFMKFRTYESVPNVEFSCNGISVRKLDNDRDLDYILFAGAVENTSCCQKIGGAGESTVLASYFLPNAGVYGFFYRSQMIAQSFVWREKDALTFDNIEVNHLIQSNSDICENIKNSYKMLFDKLIGILGIREIYIGCSYSDIQLDEYKKNKPNYLLRNVIGNTYLDIYSDAIHQVWQYE